MCNAAWAQVTVPTPVYFNDFSSTTDLTQVGSGEFIDDSDPRFGKIYHNDPENTSAIRTNYLKLPSDVLSHSATSNEMTIGFWVNKKSENDFWFSPLFSAYGAAPSGGNGTPMLVCETRGLIQLNCSGYCDFGITDETPGTTYNDGTPSVDTYWLDDGSWHYYTVVFTTTTAKVYIDGVLKNGWTVDGTSGGQVISGLFTNGSSLKYVCLGGNQAWTWGDADPAFGFDDFAVYDEALSAEQIAKIISDKNFDYTVVAKDGSGNTLKTIAEGTYSGTAITVYYPQNILQSNTIYSINKNGSSPLFGKTFTPNVDNYVYTLNYNNTPVDNVVYYSEAENITGLTTHAAENHFSGQNFAYTSGNSTYVKIVTLPAGKYKIYARYYDGNSGEKTFNFKLGDDGDVILTRTLSSSGQEFNGASDEFTLASATDIKFACDGANDTGLDWVYIVSTSSNEIIGAIDYSTGFMGAHKDFTISKGESIKLNFQNHGIGGTDTQWFNWLVRLSGTTGVNHTLRADNWVLGDDGGTVSTRSITQDGSAIDNWSDFCEAMKDASVEMTITYTADGMFSIEVEATGNTHTFVHNFAYKEAKDGDITIELGVEKAWLELLSADANQLVTFGAIDWTTFVSTKNLDFSKVQAGLAAYIVTGNSGSAITKEDVTGIVPAGTPLLLSGTANNTFTVSLASSAGSAPVGNLLKAGNGSAVGYVTGKTRYVLSADGTTPVFKKLADGGYSATVPVGKAYLEFDGVVSAHELTFDFDSETTAISEAKSQLPTANGQFFNLAGQRVANPTKGLYIVNGRKFIIK